MFARGGVAISPSTLVDLFHRSAHILRPLADRLVELAARAHIVHADETGQPVQDKDACRRGYIWTFIARVGEAMLVTYRFSASRSGETPAVVLGRTTGYLQVDAYSGYNQVTVPAGRERVGCWAHVRRKFFEALSSANESGQWAIEQIRQLYEVEFEAAEAGILGTERHLAQRQLISKPIVSALYAWAEEEQGRHLPKGPMGTALRYLLNQREHLERFLSDARLALDNNLAERCLRIIALGRKNFMFVGNDESGENLAVLQTLVSSCIANGVNPQEYLADVLVRTGHHPQSRIDELLPHNWQPPSAQAA
jgi:transposase